MMTLDEIAKVVICRYLEDISRIENLEKRVEENELLRVVISQNAGDLVSLIDRVQELEQSQIKLVMDGQEGEIVTVKGLNAAGETVEEELELPVAESATSEDRYCIWVARDRDKSIAIYSFNPIQKEDCFDPQSNTAFVLLPEQLFPNLTFENSPQKLVLESSIISKKEAVEMQWFDRAKVRELVLELQAFFNGRGRGSSVAYFDEIFRQLGELLREEKCGEHDFPGNKPSVVSFDEALKIEEENSEYNYPDQYIKQMIYNALGLAWLAGSTGREQSPRLEEIYKENIEPVLFQKAPLQPLNLDMDLSQDIDRERALELLDDIKLFLSPSILRCNKVVYNAIEELRQMLGGSDEA